MTNPERDPDVITCPVGTGDRVEVLAPRDVPLGGPRAMRVRRTLPQRERSLVGAWCFADHYGPDEVAKTGGMSVPPHPHTGLQTVSWLFSGEIEHRDSAGNHAVVRPGELNLMTAGRGISHSEVSTPQTRTLHGVQLWIALPDADRHTDPAFVHHAPTPVTGPGWQARVFLGSLLGVTSPVPTFTPLLGAELVLGAGVELRVEVEPGHEHGVLVDTGQVAVGGRRVAEAHLAHLPPGAGDLVLRAAPDTGTRLLLLGGAPFGEAIVMWWNFVGRSHEEVAGYRREWQEQVLDHDGVRADPDEAGGLREPGPGVRVVPDGRLVREGRFGVVAGDRAAPVPAPPLPRARLKGRR